MQMWCVFLKPLGKSKIKKKNEEEGSASACECEVHIFGPEEKSAS